MEGDFLRSNKKCFNTEQPGSTGAVLTVFVRFGYFKVLTYTGPTIPKEL